MIYPSDGYDASGLQSVVMEKNRPESSGAVLRKTQNFNTEGVLNQRSTRRKKREQPVSEAQKIKKPARRQSACGFHSLAPALTNRGITACVWVVIPSAQELSFDDFSDDANGTEIFQLVKSFWKISNLAGGIGFEPTIHGIKIRCLTTWLPPCQESAFYRFFAGNLKASHKAGGAREPRRSIRRRPL